ncbi:2-dehydropantoate 2-reductase [Couchioplanes caeruleus]|uniref:2-dehydropantoate 2-reductase n=2 Tax=Couchioplanes caeruleus TaxID=56438 RepID=A0A1K0GRD6_9ACTN|nr:2-dehydropantoate 2-reductase [Couchioplanes caeruleus]OJF14966.1 2-dehydropantoate 2-reductase [Couchioplanes caeruleus subsp. caeruleus]ROP30469.1 ketopantoate reductase [Couchioplanes caeruleus]
MKVCVVGAGAVGGWIGARLSASGAAEVSAVARGATLRSLQTTGWRLQTADGLVCSPARAAADAAELGEQDLVIVAVKAPALASVAGLLPPLLGPATVVLPFMNGVPWWFGHGTKIGQEPLRSVDPDGVVAAAVAVDRVLGGVVHASCAVPEPGLVRHVMGNGLIVGEPAGGASARADEVGALLAAAGFDAVVSTDVRYDIWYKLWGNMTMNPISALTGATADQVLDDPLVREFCSAAMREAAAIGQELGCDITETPEDRHRVTARLGAFKTSMLQDVEAGRPVELDALVGAVREIGGRLGMPTPSIDALLGLSRLAARVQGLYPA